MRDPVLSREALLDPEQEALMADSVGLALLVVLETLAPGELSTPFSPPRGGHPR